MQCTGKFRSTKEDSHGKWVWSMEFGLCCEFLPLSFFYGFHRYQPVIQIWVLFRLGKEQKWLNLLIEWIYSSERSPFFLIKSIFRVKFSVGTYLQQFSDQHCISFKGSFCNLLLWLKSSGTFFFPLKVDIYSLKKESIWTDSLATNKVV